MLLTQVREEHPIWRAGSAKVDAARAAAEADRRGALLDAAQRVVDGLRSARALTLAMEAESLAQHTVNGLAPGEGVDSTEDLAGPQTLVSLDEARRAGVRARLQHTIAQARLALVMGQNPGTALLFEGELAEVAPLTAPGGALVTALATDPKSARLEQEAERAGQEARLAWAARAHALAEQAARQRGVYVPAWLAARKAYLDARAAELDLEWQAAQARLLLRSVTGSLVMEAP